MKLRIYIDEVGNSDLGSSDDPNHRFLSLTGVILDLSYVKDVLTPEMEALKTKYFESHPDDPVIFHRKELLNKKFPFHPLRDPKLEAQFNIEYLGCLKRWQYKIITILIDKKEHAARYTTWRYDPYHYCMAIIFERFHLRLQELKVVGDMMFESRGGKEDMRLKESYRGIFLNGTSYIKPMEIDETLTSRELKIKPKSANISGLQLADLLAYPSRRFALKHYNLLTDERITFNEKVIEVIEDKFFKRESILDGYGLKLLP
ncbi:MAG: DUF3800 domain-containing protein [Chitinophagales bacterium]|nr:DUF3800 domain-containing protein [Chitinophagales bacterium]